MDARTVALEAELGSVEDVSESTQYYIWHYHGVLFSFVIVACCALSFLSAYGLYQLYLLNPNLDLQDFFMVPLPLFAILGVYWYFHSKVQHLFVEELAKASGFEYSESAEMTTVSGHLFEVGHSQAITDVMSGTYKGFPVRIFSYEYTVGYGKNSHTYYCTIFDMDAGVALPHILMQPWSILMESLSGMEKVELEGNFNTHFSLYVEKGKQMEVREVYQPDMMEDMIQNMSRFSMETSGTHVYLLQMVSFSNRKVFLDLLAIVDRFYDRLIPALSAVSK